MCDLRPGPRTIVIAIFLQLSFNIIIPFRLSAIRGLTVRKMHVKAQHIQCNDMVAPVAQKDRATDS
jgi:hypothetical protein